MIITFPASGKEELFIRLNQAGFLPGDLKTAIVFSNTPVSDFIFYIRDTEIYEEQFSGRIQQSSLQVPNFQFSYLIHFTSFNLSGEYILEVDGQRSFPFTISEFIYNNITDSLLLFFKTQRCGPTNPYLHLPCHLSDATRIIGEEGSSLTDLTGGWHDAGDYIKFLNTIAYTTYMLVFAYEFNTAKFGIDNNKNNVPDILEEAKVGLDWLLRANYKKGKLVTQVQDLRDHTAIWRLPEDDSLTFDRPAFTEMGKNHIGIYTAALALASRIWKSTFSATEFSELCLKTAEEIYAVRNETPDLNESSSGAYKDNEFKGKLALGAAELYLSTEKRVYLADALEYADSLRPNYWWSWGDINALTFYRLSEYSINNTVKIYQALEHFNRQKENNIFNEGTSYSWGTTNAFLGITLQAILYKRITGKNDFDSLAIYQRDYVLGRNPWGLSFINNIGSRYPRSIHSQLHSLNGGYLPGALVAGPAPTDLLSNYNIISNNTTYELFNTPSASYFDDKNDFITNEAAISSNATALFVFGYYSRR